MVLLGILYTFRRFVSPVFCSSPLAISSLHHPPLLPVPLSPINGSHNSLLFGSINALQSPNHIGNPTIRNG